MIEPAGVPFHYLMDPLRDAFERGVIVAWVLRMNAVEHPAQLPEIQPKPNSSMRRHSDLSSLMVMFCNPVCTPKTVTARTVARSS